MSSPVGSRFSTGCAPSRPLTIANRPHNLTEDQPTEIRGTRTAPQVPRSTSIARSCDALSSGSVQMPVRLTPGRVAGLHCRRLLHRKHQRHLEPEQTVEPGDGRTHGDREIADLHIRRLAQAPEAVPDGTDVDLVGPAGRHHATMPFGPECRAAVAPDRHHPDDLLGRQGSQRAVMLRRVDHDLAPPDRRCLQRTVDARGIRRQRREAVVEHRNVVWPRKFGAARAERADGSRSRMGEPTGPVVSGRRHKDPRPGETVEAPVQCSNVVAGVGRLRVESPVGLAVDVEVATVGCTRSALDHSSVGTASATSVTNGTSGPVGGIALMRRNGRSR